MKTRKKMREGSIWTRELVPAGSIWGKELLATDSIWNRELFVRRRSDCVQCPILIMAEAHKCSHYERIPDEVWDGVSTCPVYK